MNLDCRTGIAPRSPAWATIGVAIGTKSPNSTRDDSLADGTGSAEGLYCTDPEARSGDGSVTKQVRQFVGAAPAPAFDERSYHCDVPSAATKGCRRSRFVYEFTA